MFHWGGWWRRATLAAYESCIDLSVTLFALVDSQFDFACVAHEPAASVNSGGSPGNVGAYKGVFGLTRTIKASLTEAEFKFSNQSRKAGLLS